ncbi:MAG: MFS transporter [Thermodesulfobacteriota bacterium]|jgi:NNP family nitrate/nitrite transporter-like MFS transporter
MTSQKTSPFPLTPLLILAGIFYLNFVSRVVLAPLLPVIEGDLGLGHGEAGSLFFFIAAGYAAGLLGSGFISSRLIHRHTITLSTIAVGWATLVVSRSASVNGMHAGLVLVGIFAGFYLPSGIATLTGLANKEDWGKALAIHELAPNLGFITAPLLSEALLKFFSWRESLAMLGSLSILMGLLFLFFGQGGKDRGEPPRLQSMHTILRSPSFWIMTTLFTVSIGSSIGVYTMMPLFLVSERGMDRAWANTLIGLSRTFGIFVLFFSGLIIDRVGPKQAMTLFLAATGVFTLLLGLIHGSVTTPALVFFQAAATACLFPVGFTIISLVFPPPLRGGAVSLVMFIGFLLGGGAIPSSIGHWAEAFSFSSGFSLLGVFILVMLTLFLRTATRLHLSE